jgi:hypothetical protein
MTVLTVSDFLNELEKKNDTLYKLAQDMIRADEGKMYGVDQLAIAAINRTVSTIAGFKLLIKSSNMICARTILRIQIDTALRFYSAFIVKDPHKHSIAILSGKQIDKITDSDGQRMSDRYLVDKLSKDYPWLNDVYKRTSGYIHFSAEHMHESVSSLGEEKDFYSIKYRISTEDTKYPEESWLEVVECFNASLDIFIKYLEGWVYTKSNPEKVASQRAKIERQSLKSDS